MCAGTDKGGLQAGVRSRHALFQTGGKGQVTEDIRQLGTFRENSQGNRTETVSSRHGKTEDK